MQDLTYRIADYAANIKYESLPGEVIATVKRIFLDALATTLAANTLGVGCRQIVELAQPGKGAAESTLIGFGDKLPALMAAFANGAMTHALNYDSVGIEGGHLGVAALAAPLALAERTGGVNGKDFLAALAAGTEITARLGAAIRRVPEGSHPTRPLEGQILAYFGATAAAGRVLNLSAKEMHSALGLALMQASGTLQVVLDGDPPAKAIYGAFPNQGAVQSVLLSKLGLGAECAVFEGPAGLFAAHYRGRYFKPALSTGLGKDFYVLETCFKPWPTSAVAHPFIQSALDLRAKYRLDVDQIQDIHILGGPHIRPWCEPLGERQRPNNAATAANSIFYAVAKALANGAVTLADFTGEDFSPFETVRLTERMDSSIDHNLGRSAIVEVETKTGQRYSTRTDIATGHPSKPLSYPRLVDKFFDCAQYAARPISKDALGDVVHFIERLETAPDVSVLLSLLAGKGSKKDV